MTDAKRPRANGANSEHDRAADTPERTALRAARELGQRIERELLARLRVHEREGTLPTSGRFLFYELVQDGIIPKSAHSPDGKKRRADRPVTDALTRLREKGLVPWDWIEDETRELTSWKTAPSIADYVLREVDRASLNPWDSGEEEAPLILCESRSLAGALETTAGRYACPITSTNGQAHGFLITKVAPWLDGERRVLYVGDWDWCGGQIEDHSQRTLGDEGCAWLEWERIALTAEQVAEHNLPVIAKPDERYKPVKYFDAVETEALGQGRIVAALAARLDELLPEPLADVHARARVERAALTEVAERLRELRPERE